VTLLRLAELATAVLVIWVILGGWALLDAFTAATRRERNRDLVRAAAFIPVAVGVVWVLAWFAAKARAGA
jgi:heme/copper-type cytochrome/quinol oxidase subunit 2